MKKEKEIKESLIKIREKLEEHLTNYETFNWEVGMQEWQNAERTRVGYESWINALEWVLK